MGTALSLIATILFGALGLAPFAPLEIRLLSALLAAMALIYLVGSCVDHWGRRRKAKPVTWPFIDRHEHRLKLIARVATAVALIAAAPQILSWYIPPTPTLAVATTLEIHSEQDAFKLPVKNGELPVLIDVAILRLVGGTQPQAPELPLKLGLIALSRNEPIRLTLVSVNKRDHVLVIGRRHVPIYRDGGPAPVAFCVRLAITGSDLAVDRFFRLIPDPSNAGMLYRAELVGQSCS